ncbi:SufE family protein [Hahella sp. SMD15-11]|uniref:SufE family protein n=1 Tax=Thermohahella caldifontis TaxID=3142973 RepID=A0AB39UVM8_9GAMM
MTTAVPDASLFDANPMGQTVTLDEVLDNFEFFDDWEDRYGYVIDLGKQLPRLPDEFRTEDRLIRGCQSQVWMVSRYDPDSGRMRYVVDSDALIVRGLAAIVLCALNNRTPAEVAATDMEAIFERLSLLKHLSPTRGNGVRAMVQKMKEAAHHAISTSSR